MQNHDDDEFEVTAELELPADENPAAEAQAPKMPAPDQAVGLSYHSGDAAPSVSSVGSGERAEAIIAMAKELGIYIHRDPQLLNELKRLKEGEAVPQELFAIIATILSFSYLLQGKTPEVYTRADGSRAVNIKA